MAFVNGTANSLSDLLSAIQTACTGNGWSLSGGGVLSKGTCFIELVISGTIITVRGGSGVDGGGNLTGACNTSSGRFNTIATDFSGRVPVYPTFAFPMQYYIHINTSPDEVYCVINYSSTFYEIIGFGKSTMPGLTGTGNWYCGPATGYMYRPPWSYDTTYPGEGYSGGALYSLFARDGRPSACGVDHQLDSATWTVEGAAKEVTSLFLRQPNTWNQEAILIPIRVYANRPSGFVSPVLECAHARYISILNLQDQQIITLGSDRWRVYPWWHRGLPNVVGNGTGATYTGSCGHALRYDGP